MCAICNGVADPLNHVPPDVFSHAEFDHFTWMGLNINRGEPQNWGARWGSAPWNGARCPLKQATSPYVLPHQIWPFFSSKGVRRNRRNPIIGKRWGPALLRLGTWLTPKACSPVPWLDTLRPPCKILLAATGFYVQFKIHFVLSKKNCHHTLAAPLRLAAPATAGAAGP